MPQEQTASSKAAIVNHTSHRPHHVYLWILSFLRPYLVYVLLMIACGVVITVSELIIPKFIQHFIDFILPEHNLRAFWWMLAVAAFICLLLIAATIAQNMLQRVLREKAARDLQISIFKHLRKLGFSYFERHPVGETLSLLNTEVTAIQEIYRVYLPFLIQDSLFVIVALTILTTIHLPLTLVLIPCFLLYYLVGPYYEKRASKTGKMVTQNRIQLNKQIYESVTALPEFRVYGRENWDMARFMDKLRTFTKNQLKLVLYAYLRGTVRRLCNYSGAIAVFAYGAYLIKQQHLTIGGFVAFALLYFITMMKLTVIVTHITEQRLLMFQGDILYSFIKQQPDIVEDVNPIRIERITGQLELIQVSFGYPQGSPVIRDFTLHIQAGERVALVGTSGNGKSTLLKLISRFYDPQAGEIRLDGVPLRRLSFEQLRDAVGYVFQETYLFGSSVRDNIGFGKPDASPEAIVEAAKAAYAHDFIMQLPEQYDTLVGERGVKLSGGQRQRLSLARLFLKDPHIILLDEATSALDNVSEREVQAALDRLMQGRTTITVAHRLSTVRHADRIIVIDGGGVAESGSYDLLMEQRGLFYQLSEGQEQKEGITTEEAS